MTCKQQGPENTSQREKYHPHIEKYHPGRRVQQLSGATGVASRDTCTVSRASNASRRRQMLIRPHQKLDPASPSRTRPHETARPARQAPPAHQNRETRSQIGVRAKCFIGIPTSHFFSTGHTPLPVGFRGPPQCDEPPRGWPSADRMSPALGTLTKRSGSMRPTIVLRNRVRFCCLLRT